MSVLSMMPRGAGFLLGGTQHVPAELVGHLSWGAAYLGGSIMSIQIAELRAAGAHDVFLWAHPGKWLASNYQESIDDAERLCRQHGLAGYIADGETDMTPAQATAFGGALRMSAGRGFSVGFTSFAGWRLLEDVADGCNGAVWALCQIYNQSSNNPVSFARWLSHFRTLFGRAIVVAATFIPPAGYGHELSTPEGYETYLGKLPAGGAWAYFGTGRSYMYERLASWRAPNVLDSCLWILGIPTVAHLPLIWSVMFLSLVAVGIALVFLFRKKVL